MNPDPRVLLINCYRNVCKAANLVSVRSSTRLEARSLATESNNNMMCSVYMETDYYFSTREGESVLLNIHAITTVSFSYRRYRKCCEGCVM